MTLVSLKCQDLANKGNNSSLKSSKTIAAQIQELLDSPNNYGITGQLVHLKQRRSQLETLDKIVKHIDESEKLELRLEDNRKKIAAIEEARNNLTESDASIKGMLGLLYPSSQEWHYQATKDEVDLDAVRSLNLLFKSIESTQKQLATCLRSLTDHTRTLNPSHLGDALNQSAISHNQSAISHWVNEGRSEILLLTNGLVKSVAAMLGVSLKNNPGVFIEIENALKEISESLPLNRQQSSL
jgi:hypothetical protein